MLPPAAAEKYISPLSRSLYAVKFIVINSLMPVSNSHRHYTWLSLYGGAHTRPDRCASQDVLNLPSMFILT